MGKGTDKLYITHSEWAGHFGSGHSAGGTGARNAASAAHFARLPFDHCALSLKPFEIPMATADGTVYDLVNILPFIKKHGVDPVSGAKLAAGDLIKLNFHRNETTEEYCDPMTLKPFTSHTPLVAIKPSGNVFAKDTVDRLNVKASHWHDLTSDEPFTRKDIITIQDPHNLERRDLSTFHHIRNELKAEPETEAASLSGINVAAVGGAAAQLRQLASSSAAAAASAQPKFVTTAGADKDATGRTIALAPQAATSTAKKADPYNAAHYSTGRTAASLTSTSAAITTSADRALIDEEEFMFDQIRDKAYVRMITNFGNLNIELHCDKAPRTCYNFVALAKAGRYRNVAFHRLIPGFMIQGGDPTGTGKGGESIWGKPFVDEFNVRNAHKHDARGLLSMANHGPHTNGSQFFLLFSPRSHLDGKHTVFGRVVGGIETLDKIEKVEVHRATEKPLRLVNLVDVQVFKDPFEDWKTRLERRLQREADERDENGVIAKKRDEREKDRTTWLGTSLGAKAARGPVDPKLAAEAERAAKDKAKAGAPTVGRYLSMNTSTAAPPPVLPDGEPQPPPAKKRKAQGGFGSFEGW